MLKQRFMVHFGTTTITHFVGLLAGIVVARVAGPGALGVLSYGISYVSILGFITGLFGTPHIKLVSEGRDHKECMGVYARLQGASSLVYLVATAGIFLVQKYILHYPFESKQVQIVIVISLLTHFVDLYHGYSMPIFTANLQQAKANVPNFFRNLLWHLGRVVIVLLGFRAVALATWHLALAVLVAPFIYRLLREYTVGGYNKALAKEYFKYTIPILIIVVINSITHYADKLMLAHYTNTTQLGYYSAAYSISGMFMMIAGPVGSIFFPLFSKLIAEDNWAGINNNIIKYQEFLALFVFPLICVLAIAGGPVLLLVLGKRYDPSLAPFSILLIATYVLILGMPFGNIISGMGRFYLSAMINAIKLAVFMISITVLISPKFFNLGATGVALNLLLLNAVANALFQYFSKKHGDLRLGTKNLARHSLIFAISLAGFLLSQWFRQKFDLWWLVFVPAYLLAVYGALYMTGLIKKENWRTLIEAANMVRVFKYAKDEISGK